MKAINPTDNQVTSLSTQKKIFIYSIFFILQIIIIFFFAHDKIMPLIVFFMAGALLFLTFLSVERTYYLFACYIALAPSQTYLDYFPGIPIYYAIRFSLALFILLLLYWAIYLSQNNETFKLNALDYAIIAYLCICVLSTINGYYHGFSSDYIIGDLLHHLFYVVYFIFRFSPLKKNILRTYDIFFVLSILVGIEFLYGFSQTHGLIFIRRVVSRNIHLMPFAISFICSTFLYGASKKRTLIFLILLPLTLFSVFISQQRSLWLTTILTLLFFSIIYLYNKRSTIRIHFKRIAFTGFGVLIAVGAILQFLKTPVKLLIGSRLLVFLNPRIIGFDISWLTRKSEIALALKDFSHQFLIGAGFGDTIVSTSRHFILFSPDNAYAYLLWKLGLLGLVTFLIIQVLFIKNCFNILRRSSEKNEKVFALTAFINTMNLLIIGFANASVSQYEFLLLWVGVMAAIAITSHKYEKNTP